MHFALCIYTVVPDVPPDPIVFWLAGVKLAFHLLIIQGYGWFRDEFYYIACGEHLDWGYVDHPPLVAVVTATTRLLGDSLVAIRLPAALAGAATVTLAGLLARELGARRFGQGLAALAVLVATIYLPLHHILSMNAWEPLLWTGVALFVVRALDRGRAREWVYAGVLSGIALQNKHSMLFFGFALLVGPARCHPPGGSLLTRGPWLMGLMAAAIFLPNVIWEVRHGWPTLEFMQHARAHKNLALPPVAFVVQQVLVMNPVNAVVWVSGLGWLLAAPAARGWRFLGWAYLALLVLLIVTGGKDYYLAPYYPMLFAAGGVAIERWTAASRWRRWRASGCRLRCCSSASRAAPLAVPLLPVDTYVRYARAAGIQAAPSERHQIGRLPQFFADMFGWRELVEAVGARGRRTAARGSRQGRDRDAQLRRGRCDQLPRPRGGAPPAISGHNNYWLWGPGRASRDVLLILGGRRDEHDECGSLVQGGTVACGDCMPYENNQPIWICRDLKVSIEEAWKAAKSFN